MVARGGDRSACSHPAEGGQTDPIPEEANSLRSWVAKARWHGDKVERAFEALLVRSQRDEEEDTKVKKE